jgi:2-methylcitrate dehydratase PrpD
MGRLSRSHDLYAGDWHPTAVCGAAGAAHTAARLLQLDEERAGAAERLALLQAGGLRAAFAFGSDGKALQVGLAAAAGVHVARIAASGVTITADVIGHPAGFAAAFGAARETGGAAAIDENWIKPWPCCLMSHSAIEAATRAELGGSAPIEVLVHPVARRAAAYDDVEDGLQAKFSIPYLVAHVALRGEPEPASFDGVDAEVRELARSRVRVITDEALLEAEAVIAVGGEEVARVQAARGSPERPMSADELAAKCKRLAGDRLDGVLDDRSAPAQVLLDALA